jgi:membrane-bound serine protease (ClpP class)
MSRPPLRRAQRFLAFTFLLGSLLPLLAPAAQEPAAVVEPDPGSSEVSSAVVAVRIDSIIHPVAHDLLVAAIEEAEARGAAAVVVELSTPGGLLDVTRRMASAMLGTRVPVVVYVSPSGAQAASAGFFLLMAADVAAMAPGTNTGAAHPVGGQGEDIPGHMGEKAEQDAAAQIRSLAARQGRNVELAEAAVVESRSFTADEALEQGLIDLIAPSLERLLADLHGRTVEKEGRSLTLATSGATVHRVEMTLIQRLLSTVSHPNIAMMLLTLGFIGIYVEVTNPGMIFPGVVGLLSLLLAFYSLSVLPLSYLGVGLLLLAALLFVAEIYVASYGLLTVGGVVALVLGSMMLIRSPDPALQISLWLIGGLATAAVLTVLMMMTLVVRTHRSQVATGAEGLVGKHGVARSELAPRGTVFVHGELWNARSEDPVPAGGEIVVVAVEGMRLRVRPAEPGRQGRPSAPQEA